MNFFLSLLTMKFRNFRNFQRLLSNPCFDGNDTSTGFTKDIKRVSLHLPGIIPKRTMWYGRSIQLGPSRFWWSTLSCRIPQRQQGTCQQHGTAYQQAGRQARTSTGASNTPEPYGAVRAVPIHICTTTSSGKNDISQQYIQEWSAKLSRYTRVESLTFKPNPLRSKSPDVARQEESKRLLKHLTKSSSGGGAMYVVCLDERGRDADSEGMADILVKASDQGYGSIAFVIGGPFGHAQEVRDMSHDTIRLSRCVLNHSVACVVLVEQLYRAWTIIKGEPYHH